MPETRGCVPLKNIKINDKYWNRYTGLVASKILPYQWEILNDNVKDAPPSRCLYNFKLAAGDIKGERKGMVFQDSDAAKWLEAVAYSLASHPDPDLEKKADSVIDLICRAQQKDGYLNTYYTLVEPENRWQNLCEGHELYCAGHFIEAAVAYYQSTGKGKLLDCLCRFADLIAEIFGPEENQIHGYPGHPEIEMALVKLYRITGKKNYLNLAEYFINTRGSSPNYFLEEMKRPGFKHIFNEFMNYDPVYSQSHIPLREQKTAEGHAVRAVYLYCAMADIAELNDDKQLLEQCKILWRNITGKRMFITGSIGSSGMWERFTTDYDLPNDSNYSETCASIGLFFFGFRMAEITHESSYIDVCERALYNTIRAGISMRGDRYFYVNPLEVWPAICMDKTSRAHVKAVRQKWFDVACCPTNIARTLASLGRYIYTLVDSGLFVNLFIQNEAEIPINGDKVKIKLETDYPKTGEIKLRISGIHKPLNLHLRIPIFAKNTRILFNGKISENAVPGNYFSLCCEEPENNVEMNFDIVPEFVYANPLVRANCGKSALIRGPEVYCLEECDNGENLASVYVDTSKNVEIEWKENLMAGTTVLHCRGFKLNSDTDNSVCIEPPEWKEQSITAIPYGSWGNRKEGEMIVWMHVKDL